MVCLPEAVREAWEDRDGPVILATVNPDTAPNIIYASCVGAFGDDRLVVADNFFDKTRKNLLSGSKGSILFRCKKGKAYQVKGEFQRFETSGETYDKFAKYVKEKLGLDVNNAAIIKVAEVFSGGGKQIA